MIAIPTSRRLYKAIPFCRHRIDGVSKAPPTGSPCAIEVRFGATLAHTGPVLRVAAQWQLSEARWRQELDLGSGAGPVAYIDSRTDSQRVDVKIRRSAVNVW